MVLGPTGKGSPLVPFPTFLSETPVRPPPHNQEEERGSAREGLEAVNLPSGLSSQQMGQAPGHGVPLVYLELGKLRGNKGQGHFHKGPRGPSQP